MSEPLGSQPSLPAQNAFVVQLRAGTQSRGTFLGRIEHIASGRAREFHSADDLLEFMTCTLHTMPRRKS